MQKQIFIYKTRICRFKRLFKKSPNILPVIIGYDKNNEEIKIKKGGLESFDQELNSYHVKEDEVFNGIMGIAKDYLMKKFNTILGVWITPKEDIKF